MVAAAGDSVGVLGHIIGLKEDLGEVRAVLGRLEERSVGQGREIGEIKRRVERLDGKFDQLPCNQHEQDITVLTRQISSLCAGDGVSMRDLERETRVVVDEELERLGLVGWVRGHPVATGGLASLLVALLSLLLRGVGA